MKHFTVIKNFLDPDTFNKVVSYAMNKWTSSVNSFKTNQHWPQFIIKDSNIILTHDIEDNDIIKKLSHSLKKVYDYKKINELMIYYYNPGCHIPWHDDAHSNGSVTIYLNDEWDIDHGGLFMYNEGDGIRAISPEKNMLVFQLGGIPHSVSVLSPRAPVRVTIQAFFDKH